MSEIVYPDKTRVFLKDCMEGMREYPDKYFDLAIVDPPYGINIVAPGKRSTGARSQQKNVFTKYKAAKWDAKIPDPTYFSELFRVSKNQIIFGGNYFAHLLPPSRGWIVWDKPQPNGTSFAQAELCWTSFPISIKRFNGAKRSEIGNCVSNNKQLARVNAKIHPTQKPKSIYRWLLQKFAKPGDKILDTHLGSGSSRIAAYDMGFAFTGYEIDPDYFAAQEKRFNQFKAQTKLFVNG